MHLNHKGLIPEANLSRSYWGTLQIAQEHFCSCFICFKYLLAKSSTKSNTWTPYGLMMFMRSITRDMRFINQGVVSIDL